MALTVHNAGGGGAFIKAISVITQPTKTSYTAGETLDLTGMVVHALYSDNTEVDITSLITTSPTSGTAIYESTKSITINYTWADENVDYTTQQLVSVTRVLSSLTITAPTKTSYNWNETLDLTGAVATATFNSGATETVTASYSPANGSSFSSVGTKTITATYTENGVTKTATTSVNVTITAVTWAAGTDAQIVDMVAAADAGVISLSDYWAVGDERTIPLTAMAQTVSGLSETHAAQNIVMVLMNAGGKTLTAGGTCNFVVGQKNTLGYSNNTLERGMMNSSNSNTGGWKDCPRRTWCNDIYKNAFPSALLPIFKQFQNVSGVGDGASSGTQTTDDYFALPSEMEIFGSRTYSFTDEASACTQWTYYKTASNRIKYYGSGNADYWWQRSPYSGTSANFCSVSSGGGASAYYASNGIGIAPFCCI